MVENYKKYIEEISNRTGFIKSTLEKVERFQSYFAEIPYANGKCECFRDYKNYNSKWIKEEFINN